MNFGHAEPSRVARDFRVMPFNGESDWRVAEYAEIVTVVRVLRNPLTGKNQVLSESLFETSMEFIAKARTQWIRSLGRAEQQRRLGRHSRIRCWKAQGSR